MNGTSARSKSPRIGSPRSSAASTPIDTALTDCSPRGQSPSRRLASTGTSSLTEITRLTASCPTTAITIAPTTAPTTAFGLISPGSAVLMSRKAAVPTTTESITWPRLKMSLAKIVRLHSRPAAVPSRKTAIAPIGGRRRTAMTKYASSRCMVSASSLRKMRNGYAQPIATGTASARMMSGLPHPWLAVSATAAIVAPSPARPVPATTNRVARFTIGAGARRSDAASRARSSESPPAPPSPDARVTCSWSCRRRPGRIEDQARHDGTKGDEVRSERTAHHFGNRPSTAASPKIRRAAGSRSGPRRRV